MARPIAGTGRMKSRIAITAGFVAMAVCPSGAQTKKSGGQWTGTITATVNAKEPGFDSVGEMNCKLTGSSARCTYNLTMKASGKDAYVITQSATQEHLQVSVVQGKSEWKLLVAAFISRGTSTITSNGKSLSGNDVSVQAPNWEVPLAVPRDPNRLFGTWKSPLGDVIKWDLGR